MNRMLASALAFFNTVIAVIIVGSFTLLGSKWPGFGNDQNAGVVVGFVIGIVVASLACGTVAYLALIEKHLRTLVKLRVNEPRSREEHEQRPMRPGRVEPTL